MIKNNFQFSADVGILFAENASLTSNGTNPSPWFGLSIGKRFGEDISILKEQEKTSVKNIISLNMGLFDVFLGVAYERLLTPYWSLEAGIGLVGLSVGSKFYFPSNLNSHVNFHIGAIGSTGALPFYGPTGIKTYIPLGVSYLSKNNKWYSFDAGPQFWHDNGNELWPCLNIRLGKAF